MTGCDQKCLHVARDAKQPVKFTVEVDFCGHGAWQKYEPFTVPARSYRYHEFPAGFSAHGLRVTANKTCTATAQLHYT